MHIRQGCSRSCNGTLSPTSLSCTSALVSAIPYCMHGASGTASSEFSLSRHCITYRKQQKAKGSHHHHHRQHQVQHPQQHHQQTAPMLTSTTIILIITNIVTSKCRCRRPPPLLHQYRNPFHHHGHHDNENHQYRRRPDHQSSRMIINITQLNHHPATVGQLLASMSGPPRRPARKYRHVCSSRLRHG